MATTVPSPVDATHGGSVANAALNVSVHVVDAVLPVLICPAPSLPLIVGADPHPAVIVGAVPIEWMCPFALSAVSAVPPIDTAVRRPFCVNWRTPVEPVRFCWMFQ